MYRRKSSCLSLSVAAVLASGTFPMAQSYAQAQGEDTLEEIVVTGLNFRYETVESANKMPLAAKDTPQSLKLITEDVIEFAGIETFEDVYKVDASGMAAHTQDGYIRNYYRGFRVSYGSGTNTSAIKVDGYRMTGGTVLDLAPFERFEIVKGATSVLYGQAQVAGTLNAISKKPQAEPGGSIDVEYGSFDHKRIDVDGYGALSADEKLMGRLVMAYLDEETFVDFGFSERYVVAPSLKYQFSPDTSLSLRALYQQADFSISYGRGLQFLGGDPDDPANYRIPAVPRELFTQGPKPGNDAETDSLLLQLTGEHRFGDSWTFRGSVQSNEFNSKRHTGWNPAVIEPDGAMLVELYESDSDDDAFAAEINLFGEVPLFGRDHTLFFGVDYAHYEGERRLGAVGATSETTGFGLNNLDYSVLPPHPGRPRFTEDDLVPGTYDYFIQLKNGYDNKELGGTVQLMLNPHDKLKVILGTRFSRADISTATVCCDLESYDAPLPPFNEVKTEAWTYQAGLAYAVTDRINLYANYGDSFIPSDAIGVDGNFLGPEKGESYEVGAKGDLLNRRVSWSAALFHIERGPLVESVPGDLGFSRLIGKQRSRGLELDAQGELLPGWDVYSSLAFIDSEYVEGQFDGYPSPFGPKLGASLYTSYELQEGPLRGFGVGGGVVYKHRGTIRPLYGTAAGAYFTDLFDDFTEVDLRVFYRGQENWYYQLGVTNLFNELYYSPEGQDLSIDYGISPNPPRQITAKVTRRF